MPSADHDLRNNHIARRQSFRFGESIYNALNNNNLSRFSFISTMALSISIILCNIIAAASANIRLERRHLCGHPIVLPALLTSDDGVESWISNEPLADPIRQGLTEIVVPGYSGLVDVMVDHFSYLCLLLASYCTVLYI